MSIHAHNPDQSGHEVLGRLLSERNQHPERAARIDESIRRMFDRTVAILALDMCHFTATTGRLGIIHYLAMIHQMGEAARPAVEGNGGQIVKQEADNLFAVFADPAAALEAAIDVLRSFEAVNTVVPDDRDLYASIGIGFGPTLVIDEEDLFGHEMNLACKLGEDLAGEGEILLTPAAVAALPPGRYACAPVSFHLGVRELQAYRYERMLNEEPASPD